MPQPPRKVNNNRISITIPTGKVLFKENLIYTAMQDTILAAGGATVNEAKGHWFDDSAREYKEHVTVYHMWYSDYQQNAVLAAVETVRRLMYRSGEIAVLIETLSATENNGQVQQVHILEVGDALILPN